MKKGNLLTAILSLLVSIYTLWLNCNHLGTIEEQLQCVATHMKGNNNVN